MKEKEPLAFLLRLNPEDGRAVNDSLAWFSGVTREQAEAVLEHAKQFQGSCLSPGAGGAGPAIMGDREFKERWLETALSVRHKGIV